MMRRSRHASGRGSAVSSKIAWLWSSLTPSVSWSTVLSFRRMPTWLTRQRRRERRRRRDHRAALPRGFTWCSRAHSVPPFSTSHSSSGDTGPHSTLSHWGQSGLLLLSRMSRRSGCSSRGYAPTCFRVTTVGSLVTLHGTAQCHPSKASNRANKVRSRVWPTSSRGKCTTPPLRVFLRALRLCRVRFQ